MLTYPKFNLIGIDPGANTGICVAHCDMTNKTMTVLDAYTLVLDDCLKSYPIDLAMGKTRRELLSLFYRNHFKHLFDWYEPDHVIYEAAYNSRSLVAYESLVFYGNTIKQICYEHDFDLSVESVPPSQVKSSLGVKGNSGDKEAVQKAVLLNPQIKLSSHVDGTLLSEHAWDAIGIAHHAFKYSVNRLPWENYELTFPR